MKRTWVKTKTKYFENIVEADNEEIRVAGINACVWNLIVPSLFEIYVEVYLLYTKFVNRGRKVIIFHTPGDMWDMYLILLNMMLGYVFVNYTSFIQNQWYIEE